MAESLERYERARDTVSSALTQLEALLPAPHEGVTAAATRLKQGKFVLAVVGEFSSGKSFLLNALLQKFRYEENAGTKQLVGLLATDINPSTATITELDYAPETEATAIYEDHSRERIPLDALNRFIAVGSGEAGTKHDATKDERGAPARVIVQTDSPFLQRGFLVADTPGLASINPAHRRATLGFLPNADAVLYLIDTQQPFTEGDAAFLGIIRKHIDSIFIVQTKIDLWQERQSDGKMAWENAHDRIAALAAVHAPGTHVYALSAREYAEGVLDEDDVRTRESRFPQFLAALDASLIHRTGRARLRRAREQARLAAGTAFSSIDTDRAMLALDEPTLQERRAIALPELDALDARVGESVETILAERGTRQATIQRQGDTLLEQLEQQLLQSFDTADIARLRDRARLHSLIDRTIAEVVGQFAERIASESITELTAALEHAHQALSGDATLSFSLHDEAAHAFNGEPGTHTWSGDLDGAIAGTIVLDAVGGPSVSLVHDVAQRFAANPPGQYMKRELIADLRSTIFPRFHAELCEFIRVSSARIATIYDALATSLRQCATTTRERRVGSIDRALQARETHANETQEATLASRREAIEEARDAITAAVDAFVADEESTLLEDTGSQEVRIAHSEPDLILESNLDATRYQQGLKPQRWRVAVLGALRRGKSSLINAFAGETILTDDIAGSARFPIHVRYGEHDAAFALDAIPYGTWKEIRLDQTTTASAVSPVLRLTPWKYPRELVLVHAPAIDSGEPHAEDINIVVAAQASAILCLFSRQLSDRELSMYERVAELGKPMFFVHTIADNESAKERRNVVELASHYLRERNIPVARLFTISAHEYGQAKAEKRAPAGWNELGALISTIEGQAESHMARLVRLERAATEQAGTQTESGEGRSKPQPSKPGFFARLFKVSPK